MEKLPVFFKNVNLKTTQFQNIKFQRSSPTNKSQNFRPGRTLGS